ncbi:MAG: EamA family transporter [Pseudooceanicola sp.]|jgi:drug/metabolite transporter (DMT)-like permease|nr:EamA family transporter [Pseudooceanicola sp.]
MNATFKAALWMIGAIVSFTLMAIAGRAVSHAADTFEIMLYRSLFGLIAVAIYLSATGKWRLVRTPVIGLHVTRNILHFTGQNLWFLAITLAPLALVFSMEFTAPLWVLVLSPLFLGETMTRMRGLCAALGFVGILIVARPDPAQINMGFVAAAVAAIFFAGTHICTKRLTRTDATAGIMFWITALQLVLGVITAGYDGDILLPNAQTAPWLALIGLCGLVAHTCITTALSIAPASVVVPFDFARLPTIAIVAMVLYAEPLDPWILLGAALIFAANYLNIMTETRKRRSVPLGIDG